MWTERSRTRVRANSGAPVKPQVSPVRDNAFLGGGYLGQIAEGG